MLENKVAVITGSSSGIGAEIAKVFANYGAKVVVNYSSTHSKERAESIVSEIKALGREAIAVMADVSNFEDAKMLIESTIKAFGKIDVLVNNAGITKDMLLLRMTEEEFDRVIEVNLKGVFNCTKHASRVMLRSGGSIINMTSVVGVSGNVGQSNYAASKAGIIGFTKSLAKEFGSKNLRINAIAPGFIVTPMTNVLSDTMKENVIQNVPLKRLGEVKEVANVAVFLASDLSSYITGEVIKVDGGMAI